MVLEKPKDQSCENCYYCLSRISKIQVKAGGILSDPEFEDCDIFSCHRNAPTPDLIIYAPDVPKTYWCGEWKERK